MDMPRADGQADATCFQMRLDKSIRQPGLVAASAKYCEQRHGIDALACNFPPATTNADLNYAFDAAQSAERGWLALRAVGQYFGAYQIAGPTTKKRAHSLTVSFCPCASVQCNLLFVDFRTFVDEKSKYSLYPPPIQRTRRGNITLSSPTR